MKSATELAIDFENTVNHSTAENFTVLLFRLMLKSDSENRAKLAMGFPMEAKMVELYRNNCPYKTVQGMDSRGFKVVDFKKLAEMAAATATPW